MTYRERRQEMEAKVRAENEARVRHTTFRRMAASEAARPETVDDVIAMFDSSLEREFNTEDITIERARLYVAMLNKVPEWAPKFMEDFGPVRDLCRQFMNRPMEQRTILELDVHLRDFGCLTDVVYVEADDAIYDVTIGPLEVQGFDDSGQVSVGLPMFIDQRGEEGR